ncbi:hypothetical protein BN971_00088 [Mycobacterium bohemicum DSM 44277]|nr:hypothetical protein [Mycobacterium bohemicum]CPR01477.1 hypothetical protein BN971_00088 [Mycobacterium bohemicum DSM 44277]
MLLPLGSPLPDDSVSAVRGESGMLGALSVPLTWGVAVPPDDYNHWSSESDDPDAVEAPVPGLITTEPAEGIDEWDEQAEWNVWEEEAEPRFDIPRTNKVVPHSPAAG